MLFVTEKDGSRWLDIDSLDENIRVNEKWIIDESGERIISSVALYRLLDQLYRDIAIEIHTND